MERLTIRNSDGSVSQPTGLNWEEALNRLAAYEDTGMTPKEVHDMLAREVSKKPRIHRAYEEEKTNDSMDKIPEEW